LKENTLGKTQVHNFMTLDPFRELLPHCAYSKMSHCKHCLTPELDRSRVEKA